LRGWFSGECCGLHLLWAGFSFDVAPVSPACGRPGSPCG